MTIHEAIYRRDRVRYNLLNRDDKEAVDIAFDALERLSEDKLYGIIKDAPTIDAVPVVRCRDCKWWNKAGCAISIVDETDRPKEDDFCSFGERKDGEG